MIIGGRHGPAHFSKPVAEAMQANIETVGLPKWDDNDQALAKGLQRELGAAPDWTGERRCAPPCQETGDGEAWSGDRRRLG